MLNLIIALLSTLISIYVILHDLILKRSILSSRFLLAAGTLLFVDLGNIFINLEIFPKEDAWIRLTSIEFETFSLIITLLFKLVFFSIYYRGLDKDDFSIERKKIKFANITTNIFFLISISFMIFIYIILNFIAKGSAESVLSLNYILNSIIESVAVILCAISGRLKNTYLSYVYLLPAIIFGIISNMKIPIFLIAIVFAICSNGQLEIIVNRLINFLKLFFLNSKKLTLLIISFLVASSIILIQLLSKSFQLILQISQVVTFKQVTQLFFQRFFDLDIINIDTPIVSANIIKEYYLNPLLGKTMIPAILPFLKLFDDSVRGLGREILYKIGFSSSPQSVSVPIHIELFANFNILSFFLIILFALIFKYLDRKLKFGFNNNITQDSLLIIFLGWVFLICRGDFIVATLRPFFMSITVIIIQPFLASIFIKKTIS